MENGNPQGEESTFTLSQLRGIFFYAFNNWLANHDQVSRFHTSAMNGSEQTDGDEIRFVRLAIGILREESDSFPKEDFVDTGRFDDNTILFLAVNLPDGYARKKGFERLAQQRKVWPFQASIDEPEPTVPRPDFIKAAIEHRETALISQI